MNTFERMQLVAATAISYPTVAKWDRGIGRVQEPNRRALEAAAKKLGLVPLFEAEITEGKKRSSGEQVA